MRFEKFLGFFSMLAAGLLGVAGCAGRLGRIFSAVSDAHFFAVRPMRASLPAGNGTEEFWLPSGMTI